MPSRRGRGEAGHRVPALGSRGRSPGSQDPRFDTRYFLLCLLCASAVNLAAEPAPRDGAFLPPEAAASLVSLPFVPRADDPAVLRGKGVVKWRQWNGGALAEAARGGKPLFVFVTANWCHWGKVMERVTFTDLEVATRLNEEFIPVRLDRDARPDLDLRLQQAVQSLSGRRGWPLTAILTPEGHVFAGGTFFPAEDDAAAGRPGLRGVIHQAMRAWRDERAEVVAQAKALSETLKKDNESAAVAGKPPADILQRVALATQSACDAQAGGLLSPSGGAVGKFPTPRALELCLLHHAIAKDKRSLDVVRETIDAMLRGAVYDQLGGGFHRCSADRWWREPRFEKLLAPNAEMLPALLHAWQATQEPRYRRAAEETLDFWAARQDAGGTFFCGSVAGGTSDLDDGLYYTWTVKELESVLRDDGDCRFACVLFGASEAGNLPAVPGRNVLFEALSPEDAAARSGVPRDGAQQRLNRVREALRAARLLRPAPAADRTVYVDGNALMAAAFIECGRGLGSQPHLARGVKTLRGLLKEGTDDSGALHVLPRDALAGFAPRLAHDEAALLHACAGAYEATGEKEFLDAAESSLRRLDQNFLDRDKGGYFDRSVAAPGEAAGLAWRVKVCQDTDQASTNGLIARACIRLAGSTSRREFADRAAATISAFGAVLEKLGPYGASLVEAHARCKAQDPK